MKKIFFTFLISIGLVFGSVGITVHNNNISNIPVISSTTMKLNTANPHPIG